MKEEKVRQLAAVMFTDIVGYTALMQEDEAVAIKVRAKHRKVFEEQHKLYQGEIIQYYGDGALSIFRSAIQAAKCAIEVQRRLQEGDPVPMRMGLHMGDIVFNKTEVYGDGVNFASRIESMGVAGAVLLSGKLNEELKNHTDISTTSLGHFQLKNINAPVEVFAISNDGIVVPSPHELKGKQKVQHKTIAVLPFVNMSSNADNEYFSDGITEEIINALSKIKSLKVTSRTSSFFFKNKNIPIKQIASELNVSAILEGSIRVSNDTIRITAQLIQAEEDFHFWSESWDREMKNIFEIQDEISLIIAEKLRENFGHFEIQDHLVNPQTQNIDAYEYSLKARFHYNKWNPEDVNLAISLYEKALELDAEHTESLLGLADCYGFLGTTGFLPGDEAWGKAAQLTDQAYLLNDQLPGVYYQRANLSFFVSCDFENSYKQALKAIELKPNYVEAQQFVSFLYMISGQMEKAEKHLDIALAIDPLSQETQFFNAYFHYKTGDFNKALVILDDCLDKNPKNIPAHTVKCYCLLMLNRHEDVLHYFDSVPKEIIVPVEKIGIKGLVFAAASDEINIDRQLELLAELANTPDGYQANSYIFMMYASLRKNDEAFAWIDQAIETKSNLLLIHFADPLANPIKDDLRYPKIQKKLFPIVQEEKKSQSGKILLDKDAAITYSNRLLNYMDEERPYLDSSLSLRSLAVQIDMHPNQLSWLLNESIGKNFNEFVNHYRVEAFKRLATDPNNAHITLIGLAYESGFNSKTVFNTYFKKETGHTPKQFLKQQN